MDGDFAGFVTLNGDNSALTGGIQLIGGVELNVSSLANLGGATATLKLQRQRAFHPVGGFIVRFRHAQCELQHLRRRHRRRPRPDVHDQSEPWRHGQHHRIDRQARLRHAEPGRHRYPWRNHLLGFRHRQRNGLRIAGLASSRSPVVNITGTVTTTSGYSSFGQDSTGTNGGPDMATVTLSALAHSFSPIRTSMSPTTPTPRAPLFWTTPQRSPLALTVTSARAAAPPRR